MARDVTDEMEKGREVSVRSDAPANSDRAHEERHRVVWTGAASANGAGGVSAALHRL